jgi:hypothetical protein
MNARDDVAELREALAEIAAYDDWYAIAWQGRARKNSPHTWGALKYLLAVRLPRPDPVLADTHRLVVAQYERAIAAAEAAEADEIAMMTRAPWVKS